MLIPYFGRHGACDMVAMSGRRGSIRKGRRFVKWLLGLALTVTALSGILHWVVAPPTGLVRSFYSDVDFAGDPLVQDRTTEVSLAFLDRDPTLPRRFFSVQWRGYWYLPEAQTVTVYAGADDRVVLSWWTVRSYSGATSAWARTRSARRSPWAPARARRYCEPRAIFAPSRRRRRIQGF